MQNPSIKELRDAGFKVSVRHYRRWEYQPPRDVLIMKHETPQEVSQVNEASRLPTLRPPGWYLCATGGRTEVRLTLEGMVAVGITDCSLKEHYNKRDGRNKALGRALAEFEAKTAAEITREGLRTLIASGQQYCLPDDSPAPPAEKEEVLS